MNQIINTSISRRRFVVSSASLAGGLAITGALPGLADAASIAAQPYGTEVPTNEINAFLAISPDGSVLIRSPHNEMGQGAITALPMIVAEELECAWSKVKADGCRLTTLPRQPVSARACSRTSISVYAPRFAPSVKSSIISRA